MTTTFIGACLCGAVAFSVTAPTKWCAHCHCSMCRRAHGAGFVTWFGVERGQLTMTKGEETLGTYASSANATRSFCRTCGSPLFFQSTRWPTEIHIARASVAGEIDRAPQCHVFVSDHAPWISIADDLPQRGGPTGTEPLEMPIGESAARPHP